MIERLVVPMNELFTPTHINATPFDQLTRTTLEFLLERTNFEEPWCRGGFVLEVKRELEQALERKEREKRENSLERGGYWRYIRER